MAKKVIPLMLICLILSGCVKLEGEFTIKKSIEDNYRRAEGPLEFEKDSKVKWAYIFKNIKRPYKIVVTVLKKEIVWVDISNRVEEISPAEAIIRGDIENFSDGTYRIVLTESDKIINEMEFLIYSEEEDYKFN